MANFPHCKHSRNKQIYAESGFPEIKLLFYLNYIVFTNPSLTVKRRKKFKKARKSGKDEDFAISWNDVIFRVVWREKKFFS